MQHTPITHTSSPMHKQFIPPIRKRAWRRARRVRAASSASAPRRRRRWAHTHGDSHWAAERNHFLGHQTHCHGCLGDQAHSYGRLGCQTHSYGRLSGRKRPFSRPTIGRRPRCARASEGADCMLDEGQEIRRGKYQQVRQICSPFAM
jgi:hypothetical protein